MVSFLGRIKTVKDLFLDKLDSILERVEAIEAAANTTLKSVTTSLEASTYLVDSQSRESLDQEMFLQKISAFQAFQAEAQQKQAERLAASLEKLAAGQNQLPGAPAERVKPGDTPIVVRVADAPRPVLALIAHLYSFLPARTAAVAAKTDDDAAAFLQEAGFALEVLTAPPQAATAVGLVRVAPEAMLQDFGELGCAVVACEYGDKPVLDRELGEQVAQMRRRGYHWHIVLYSTGTDGETSFYCNRHLAIEKARGAVLFFREHPLFAQAHDWCRAVLPATYLR
ncbi:hypothetical protein [Gloeobacter morelensis]|uniref:Uncharacterized protein n=1 Tax=Gloeobacter morelensis MG652769 TaxID=2781736 RepID=A0ABY3PHC8_9CYAN|nr:hypothetical protein [Gloeobacter morelensis]UFP93073.1 hypothetical protein ISF26_14785 [Gloeobacter morelensis MG652769]